MRKLLFIFNPFSGKAKIKNYLCNIIDSFNKAGYEVTAYATQYKGQAKEIAFQKGGGYDLIVCSGGDGTLNEVVSGLMGLEKKPNIGYIPSGSTNDFANSIGLPKSITRCTQIAAGGIPFPCDIGQFGKKYFVYVAAFGAFTEVSYMTPQQTKNLLGHQAYLLEGVKQLGNIKPVHMKFECENHQEEGDYLFGMISNATSVGGFKNLTGESVKLNDGLFEVVLVKETANLLELPLLLSNLLAKEKDDRYVSSFKCSRMSVHNDRNVSWSLDGEFGGETQDIEIAIHECAVNILLEQKKNRKK